MNGMKLFDITAGEMQNAANSVAGAITMPSVAIVILNWNGKKYLEQFVPSVLASTYANKRVIVADNASTDDSVEFLKTRFPSVEIIQNNKNEGFAKGYNEALKKLEADYYVLLNSDVEVKSDWVEPVIELMEADKFIAACQPKILSFKNKAQFEYAGACGGWMDKFGYPFARGRVFDNCETDKGQYDTAESCFWASGAALFVRAKLYHALGGLDEFFFAHQEEIDLCWRFQLAGYKIYVQPKSVVFHVGGGTLPKGNSRKTFLNFRNNLIMLFKNMSWFTVLWKIPVRLLLDIIAACKSLLIGDTGFFLAVLKAHIHFFKWVLFEKHNKDNVKKKSIRLNGFYKGSIVWDHFVKKKKTFFEIIGNK